MNHLPLYEFEMTRTRVMFDNPDMGAYWFEGQLCAMEIAKEFWKLQHSYGGYHPELNAVFSNEFDFEYVDSAKPNDILVSALYYNYSLHRNDYETMSLCRRLTDCTMTEAKNFVKKHIL